MSVAISVYRGCAGGYVGAGGVHPALLDAVREATSEARESGKIADGFVARCGDDIGLVLLHDPGVEHARRLAETAFAKARAVGGRLAQHGANGDGRTRLDGVHLELTPRTSEPVLCFFSDKAGAGAWNGHLYRMFADPFNSPSLVCDERMLAGFRLVMDDGAAFDLPAGLYRFMRAASSGRVVRVVSGATSETVAAASAGDDPVLVVRAEAPFPAVGEVLEAFASAVTMWPGESAVSSLMPVSTNDEAASRSGAPARAIGLGFQVSPDRLVGPRDLLADAAFEDTRRQALQAADYLRLKRRWQPLGTDHAHA